VDGCSSVPPKIFEKVPSGSVPSGRREEAAECYFSRGLPSGWRARRKSIARRAGQRCGRESSARSDFSRAGCTDGAKLGRADVC